MCAWQVGRCKIIGPSATLAWSHLGPDVVILWGDVEAMRVEIGPLSALEPVPALALVIAIWVVTCRHRIGEIDGAGRPRCHDNRGNDGVLRTIQSGSLVISVFIVHGSAVKPWCGPKEGHVCNIDSDISRKLQSVSLPSSCTLHGYRVDLSSNSKLTVMPLTFIIRLLKDAALVIETLPCTISISKVAPAQSTVGIEASGAPETDALYSANSGSKDCMLRVP